MRTILSCFISSISLAVALVTAGCGVNEPSGSTRGAVDVVATTTQLADLAANVAGGRASVTGILATNSDPHEYEPQPSDAEAFAEADLILESGGELDVWAGQVVESSGTEAAKLSMLDEVTTIGGFEGEDGGEIDDPHWWQDPTQAIRAVDAIRDELVILDPEGRREYEANAAAYVEQLEQLDGEVRACIDRVPEAQRKLVTSHDALGYYAAHYGIEVVGAAIPALTTQAQASAGETAALVDLIRETGVSTIFPEAGVSGELEDAIATEAGAEVGGELWADTLGPEGSDGATYIAAVESNTAKLAEGFSGGSLSCSIDVAG